MKKAQLTKQIVAQDQETLDHQYLLDHQIVKGVFRNLKQKNAPVRFPFRKYKQDPIKFYPADVNGKPNYFLDGQTYEVPLMIANYLNNRCYREVSRVVMTGENYGKQHARDVHGNFIFEAPNEYIDKDHRFMFVNTDFKPVKGWEEPSKLVEPTKKLVSTI